MTRAGDANDFGRERNKRVKWCEDFAEVIDVATGDRYAHAARAQRRDWGNRFRSEEVDLVDGEEVRAFARDLIKRSDRPRSHAHPRVGDDLVVAVAGVSRGLDHEDALARGLRERDPPLQLGGLAREHGSANNGEWGRALGVHTALRA